MAQTITIKQSTSTDAPTTLTNAELAYSASSNKLWIGRPGGTTSNVDAIGGKYFTDRSIESDGLSFDTATGVLTINQVGTNLDETVDLDGRYIRDKATTTALGGIKLYSGTAQSTSANAVTTTALRTYGIQLNSLDQAVVNVPWTDVSGNNKLPLAGGTMTGDVTFGDNVKAKFGTSGDMELFHDGNNSIIKDSGTGILRYTSANSTAQGVVLEVENTDSTNLSGSFIHFKDSLGITPAKIGALSNEMYLMRGSNNDRILVTNASAVELYHSNVKKFETTSTGVEVTGSITGPSAFTITPATSNGTVTIDGNLTVSGTTTTIDSTTVTIEDPIFTLGGDTPPSSDDNLDRGIEFRWHNATAAKLGFFGFDNSTGEFTFIPEATNSSNVMSGTKGTANFGTLKLDTDLAVLYGGTGRSSFTTNGIAYGNGTSAMGVTVAGAWDSTHGVGQLLSVNSSGVPTWTNNIDGGTF